MTFVVTCLVARHLHSFVSMAGVGLECCRRQAQKMEGT